MTVRLVIIANISAILSDYKEGFKSETFFVALSGSTLADNLCQ